MQLHDHLELLLRWDRGLALKEVVRRVVRPGSRVLDAGCGSGVLSLWSAQAGAAEVVGIDTGTILPAQALAKENGLDQVTRFLQRDLDEVTEADVGGRFDVILGMLYDNDPRRDEARSRLTSRIHRRLLKPGGVCVPNRVEYAAVACDWLAQDLASGRSELAGTRRALEARYELRFGALFDSLARNPSRFAFPKRLPSGRVRRDDARLLGAETVFTTLDYSAPFDGYPPSVAFEIQAPGVFTTVLWTQRLLQGDLLIFSNESVSWLDEPCAVRPGDRVALRVDDYWRATNFLARDDG